MHVHVREVQEERLGTVVADEPHALGRVALGERGLVGLLLQDRVVEHQRQRREVAVRTGLAAHVVGVGQTEEVIEAVVGRQEAGLVAAVPLADQHRRVPEVA